MQCNVQYLCNVIFSLVYFGLVVRAGVPGYPELGIEAPFSIEGNTDCINPRSVHEGEEMGFRPESLYLIKSPDWSAVIN